MKLLASGCAATAAFLLISAAHAQPVSTDLGALGAPSFTIAPVANLAPGQVTWFRFQVGPTPPTRFLDIATAGPASLDSELGLFRADGSLVASDDDGGIGALSNLSLGASCPTRPNGSGDPFAGQDGPLAPGTYFLAVGQFNTAFAPNFSAIGGGDAPSGPFEVQITLDDSVPPTPSTIAVNFGALAAPAARTDTFTLGINEVRFYQLTIPAVAAGGLALDIRTVGAFNVDTEVALYGPTGGLIATDDDSGPAAFSTLSFGAPCAPRANTAPGLTDGLPFSGIDGPLDAGTYFLAVSGFSSIHDDCFDIDVDSDDTGEVTVEVNLFTPPPPAPPPAAIAAGTLVSGAPFTTTFPLDGDVTNWVSFTVPQVIAPQFLDIRTEGPGNDTIIVLYDSLGQIVEADDDFGPGAYSTLTFGSGCPSRPNVLPGLPAGFPFDGFNGDVLPAGTYFLGVVGFPDDDLVLDNCFAFAPVGNAETGLATVRILLGTNVPSAAPPATDLGTIGGANQGALVAARPLALGEVAWFRFNLAAGAEDAAGTFLDINTVGSALAPDNDTEIGLYSATGAVLDADDDGGPDTLSQLSYGQVNPARLPEGNGDAPSGQDGDLPAGTYFLAVTSFPVFFGAPGCAFEVVGEQENSGTVSVNFNTNIGGGAVGCNVADIVSIGGFPPPDGELTVDDYTSFINAFAGDELLADIVSIGGFPPADGQLTVDDYTSFINAFAEGCPG